MFNLSWKDCQEQPEEIEEISPARCLFGAACILVLMLVVGIAVITGLSF